MNRIRITIVAMGVFFVLPIVQGIAGEDRAVSRLGGGIGRHVPSGTTTKPPVLTQAYPFSCDKGTCWCKNSVDCGEMGRLGVCKTGTFKDGKSGDGTCTMKST